MKSEISLKHLICFALYITGAIKQGQYHKLF